jgi:hypothetical protein
VHTTLSWIGRLALGLAIAAAAVLAVAVIGPLIADGFTVLARPHAL